MGKKKTKKKKCYFCGQPATSMEHIPPSQLFGKKACDKITVASCDVHNTAKSNWDDSIIKFLISILIKKLTYEKLDPVLLDVILPHSKHINEHSKKYKTSKVIDPFTLTASREFKSVNAGQNIDQWILQMAAGLLAFLNKTHEDKIMFQKGQIVSNTFDKKESTYYTREEYEEKRRKKIEIEINFGKMDWKNGKVKGPREYPQELFSWKIRKYGDGMVIWIRILTHFSWWLRFKVDEQVVNKYIGLL